MRHVFLLLVLFLAFSAYSQDEVLSLNKPAKAINFWGGGFEADKVTDGDVTTRWASQGIDAAKWIYIDLEAYCNISTVSVVWEAAFGVDYTIDVSDDATTWTTIKTVVGNTSAGQQDFMGLSGTGRYVRVNVTATGDLNWISIYEITVYGTINSVVTEPETEPISLNKPATAVSVWGEGFEASKVTDGDESTRWASQGAENEVKWIYIDLEEVYNIDSVKVIWEAAYGMDFTIDLSDDATNWTVAQTITGNASDGLQSFTDMSGIGRYIRINITAGNPAHNHNSIFEFSVYGTMYVFEPISLNKPATANSVWGDGFEASYVTDGDDATRWASQGAENEPKWIYIDLEETYNIDSVQVIWEAAYGQDFTIDVSDDAVTWTVAKSVIGNSTSGILQSYTGLSAQGRYIRINITAGNPAHHHNSLWEFLVYGSNVVAGIKDNDNGYAGINVFPNPATNAFTVETNNLFESKLTVFELTGRMVYSDSFVKSKVVNSNELGVSSLYIVKVETLGKTYVKKVFIR